MKFINFTLLIGSLVSFGTGFAQQAGPNLPLTTENQPYAYCSICSGTIWQNTSNIESINSQYASVDLMPNLNCFQATCYRSRYLVAYNYGFDIPPNAVINGIEAEVNAFCSFDSTVIDSTLVLRLDALNNIYGNNMASTNFWSATPSVRTYGSSTELWGIQLTPGDINAPDFGLYYKVYNSTVSYPSFYVDQIAITVYYSIGLSAYSVTSVPHPLQVFHDPYARELRLTLISEDVVNLAPFQIQDMQGNLCASGIMSGSSGNAAEGVISTAKLTSGCYVCIVRAGANTYAEKFIISCSD